jgi:hypothetical protein
MQGPRPLTKEECQQIASELMFEAMVNPSELMDQFDYQAICEALQGARTSVLKLEGDTADEIDAVAVIDWPLWDDILTAVLWKDGTIDFAGLCPPEKVQ